MTLPPFPTQQLPQFDENTIVSPHYFSLERQTKMIDFLLGSNDEDESKNFTEAGVWMLAALLVLLSAILIFLVIHILYRRRFVRQQSQLVARGRDQSTTINEMTFHERIERRYETIEGWMISKRVVPHDEFCGSCIHALAKSRCGDGISQISEEKSTSERSLEVDGVGVVTAGNPSCSSESCTYTECPICFEAFQADEIVSFSPNPQCSHVFHHACIKEWLLRHQDCPFCRSICMHIDLVRGKQKNPELITKHLQEYQRKHSERSATTLYCLKSGLLSIPTQVNCTSHELEELTHRIRSSIVDRDVLARHRKTNQHVKTSIEQQQQAESEDISSHVSGSTVSAHRERTMTRVSESSHQDSIVMGSDVLQDSVEGDFVDVEEGLHPPPQDMSESEVSDCYILNTTQPTAITNATAINTSDENARGASENADSLDDTCPNEANAKEKEED